MGDHWKPEQLEGLVPALLALCRETGAVIAGHYASPDAGEFEAKGDASPLTRADLDSDALLQAALPDIGGGLPVLSEESVPADHSARLAWPRYWLVDPLDGTKEFLARTGEFTVNIALVERHRPVLGVLYQPLEETAYVGIPGVCAQRYARDASGWSASALATRSLDEARPLSVLASRRHRGERLVACLGWIDRHWGSVVRDNSGSALKFCRLAEGRGDFYPRFSPCCEWDTAAGQALLEAAGGQVLGMDGRPLEYNRGESLYSPYFYALADPAHALWQNLLRESDAWAGRPD